MWHFTMELSSDYCIMEANKPLRTLKLFWVKIAKQMFIMFFFMILINQNSLKNTRNPL